MDAQERFQALQNRLRAARRHLESGDQDRALELIDAALALDLASPVAQRPLERISTGAPQPNPAIVQPALDSTQRLEQIARKRRIERCLAVVSASLESRKLADARTALAEIRELNPDHPDIGRLETEIDTAGSARGGRGSWLLATAAVVLALVLVGLWRMNDAGAPVSSATEDLVLPAPTPATAESRVEALPESQPPPADRAEPFSSGEQTPSVAPDRRTIPRANAPETPAVPIAPQPQQVEPPAEAAPPVVEPALTAAAAPSPSPSVDEVPSPAPPAPVASPPPVAAAEIVRDRSGAEDYRQIRQVLERYRAAYEKLDARSARQVWPQVDEAALGRAFEGLVSQAVTFASCDIDVRDATATAECSGTARYITKVGRQEPRIEPRSWTFRLRRSGPEWKIDQAKVDR